jgi:excinuclease ABC subunit B
MGRAARHINGKAILYADVMTGSMKAAIEETNRRRRVQQSYNEEHGITPQSIIKPLDPELVRFFEGDYYEIPVIEEEAAGYTSAEELEKEIERLEKEMRNAAKEFEFEKAAVLRDRVLKLKKTALECMGTSDAEYEGE